jgi:hypothetical protein
MRVTAREAFQGLIDISMDRLGLQRHVDDKGGYEQLTQLQRLELALAIALEETYVELPDEIFMHLALGRQSDKDHLKEVAASLVPADTVGAVPASYEERLLCYLADVDAGRVPFQRTYDTWCNDCWADVNSRAFKRLTIDDEVAPSTAAARRFLRKHAGHSVEVGIEYEQELTDLEARAANVLLRQGLYRRRWVALLPDQELLKYDRMGPKLLNQIRERIPYAGQSEGLPAETVLCPVCHGSGLMSGAERPKRGQ